MEMRSKVNQSDILLWKEFKTAQKCLEVWDMWTVLIAQWRIGQRMLNEWSSIVWPMK